MWKWCHRTGFGSVGVLIAASLMAPSAVAQQPVAVGPHQEIDWDQGPNRVADMLAMLNKHNAEQIEPSWPALIESAIRVDKTLKDTQTPDDEYVYWPN